MTTPKDGKGIVETWIQAHAAVGDSGRTLADIIDAALAEWGPSFDRIGADRLADEVAVLVRRGKLDPRSPAGDALLDYRSPPSSPRADRLAEIEEALAERDAERVLFCPDGHAVSPIIGTTEPACRACELMTEVAALREDVDHLTRVSVMESRAHAAEIDRHRALVQVLREDVKAAEAGAGEGTGIVGAAPTIAPLPTSIRGLDPDYTTERDEARRERALLLAVARAAQEEAATHDPEIAPVCPLCHALAALTAACPDLLDAGTEGA